MESTVKEERSTFDYDAAQDVVVSEELMEMDSFEYDEELPHTDVKYSAPAVTHITGRNGGDHIALDGFRYSYQKTLKSGSRFYRCVLRGGMRLGCNASLYEDPVSGEVTLSGEHVHDAKSGKCAKTSVPYRGLIATCNGYRMHSSNANAKGEIYWQCSRQSTLKCPGAATSGLDAGDLLETHKHNHHVNGRGPPNIKALIGATNPGKTGSCRARHTTTVNDRRVKADAPNLLAKADTPPSLQERSVPWTSPATKRQNTSLAYSVHPPSMAETVVTPHTSGTSQTSSCVTESSSMWNFKSREEMRNADVVLHLGDTKLYAHKAVLSAISPVLDEAFRQSVGPIAVHSVAHNGVASSGLEAFLHSIYPCGSDPSDDVLPQVTILAYRYDVRPLLRKCLERVKHSSTLSKLDKLVVAIEIADIELEDHVIASFTKNDIDQLLLSDLQYQLGEGRLLKVLAKCASLLCALQCP